MKEYTKFVSHDPWQHIPFVDVEPPHADLTYWMVCVAVVGTIGVLLYVTLK